MAANPVFTDPNAFRASVPGTPPSGGVVDKSPVAAAVGRMADSLQRLGGILYQQDQQERVMRAQVGMAEGFQKLFEQVSQEPDWETMNAAFNEGADKIQQEAQALSKDQRTSTAIDLDYHRARLRTEANVTQTVLRKRAENYLALAGKWADQKQAEALIDPDNSLTDIKEQIDAKSSDLVQAGAMSKDRSEMWRLSMREAVDYTKALAAVSDNPAQALTMLEERTGGGDGEFANFVDLDENKRFSLMASARAGSAQHAANVDEIGRQGVMTVMNGRGTGEGQFRAIVGAGANDAQTQHWAKSIDSASVARSYLVQIQTAPPAEREKLIADFYARSADAREPYLVTVVPQFEEHVRAMEQAWKTDPALAADSYFPMKQPPEGAKGVTTGQRIAQRKAAFNVMELPLGTPVLTKDESAKAIAGFKFASVDSRPDLARSMLGSYEMHAKDAVTQLLKDGMPWEFNRMTDPSTSPHLAALLSEEMGLTMAELSEKYPETADASDIRVAAKELFNENYAKGLSSADPFQVMEARRMTERLALHMGDAEKAYTLLWGDFALKHTSDTNAVRFPPGPGEEEQRKMIAATESIIDNIDDYNVITDLLEGTLLAAEIREKGGWLSYPDSSGIDAGAVLTLYGRPVVDKDGKEIRRTWRELMQYQAPAQTAAERAAAEAARSAAVRQTIYAKKITAEGAVKSKAMINERMTAEQMRIEAIKRAAGEK